MTKIAILGFGVVGSGTAEVLSSNLSLIEERIGTEIEIKYILDLRDFPDSPFAKKIVHSFDTILGDPEVTVVAECMGGSHPAYDFSLAALKAGKSVVTSNKEVVAAFGIELLTVARENGVRYLFEASVGGGIPVIRPIMNDLAANSIVSIDGILNGTTNYILTQMKENGTSFADALKDAKAHGYAEANPTADISGLDAARKIVILAALAFGKMASPSDVYVEGIEKITVKDFEIASALGYTVKLIAHAEETEGKLFISVCPRLVPFISPLSSISDVFNGILLDTDMLGQAMFYGKGAGKLPTASAVVGDILDAVKAPHEASAFPIPAAAAPEDLLPFRDSVSRFLFSLPLSAKDAVKGLPGEPKELLGRIVLLTDSMKESEAETILSSLHTVVDSDISIQRLL